MAHVETQRIYDASLAFRLAAAAARTASGAESIINLGAAGPVNLEVVFDYTVDRTTGDEAYIFYIQGSNSATFASGVVDLGIIDILDPTPLTGRLIQQVTNVKRDTVYQYLRVFTAMAGTTPSYDGIIYGTKPKGWSGGYFQRQVEGGLILRPASAAAITTGTVDGSVFDIGDGRVHGEMIVDVSVCDGASGDENYLIVIQGSNSPTFASGNVNLAGTNLHAGTNALSTANANFGTGRLIVPFLNVKALASGGVNVDQTYRYVRYSIVTAGTTPNIDAVIYLTKLPSAA